MANSFVRNSMVNAVAEYLRLSADFLARFWCTSPWGERDRSRSVRDLGSHGRRHSVRPWPDWMPASFHSGVAGER